MLYTALGAIKRKLIGRLQITDNTSTSTPIMTVGSQLVDPETVVQVVNQKEDLINLILQQIYILPLIKSHAIIADIIESLVCAELLKLHFQGQGMGLGSDVSTGSNSLEQHAYQMLSLLTVGHNIALPFVPPPQNIPGISTPQPLILPEERLRGSSPDSLSKSFIYVTKRDKKPYNRNIDFGFIPKHRAEGAEEER